MSQTNFSEGKNLEDFWKHTPINSALLRVTLMNFSQKYAFLMLSSVLYLNLFLFRVQDFIGCLYIWKISKLIFLDRKMCMESYFNKWMPPSSKQTNVQFFTLISSLCFQCASIMQVNIKSWKLSNYL